MKYKLWCLFVLLAFAFAGSAQENPKQQAFSVIRQLVQSYKSQQGLTFDISFKYSAENNRSVILDSMSGRCRVLGDQYWFSMANMESIRTPEYVIIFFNEDSLMYLSRPSGRHGHDPIAMIDSLVLQKGNVTCAVREDARWRSVTIDFPTGSDVKQIEYRIDPQSGYLLSVINTIRSERIGTAEEPKAGDPPQYAIVEAQYSNHRVGEVNAGLFESGRYFTKKGNEFFAVAPYDRYRIMLATPDL